VGVEVPSVGISGVSVLLELHPEISKKNKPAMLITNLLLIICPSIDQ
jgi:hypothetical protein